MTPRAAASALAWLVRDTFRQAMASRVFWLATALGILGIAFCLGVRLDGPHSLKPEGEIELYGGDGKPLTGPNPRPSRMGLGFGVLAVGQFRDVASQVDFLEALMAKWIAGVAGTLLFLVWTAGILPESLQPAAASVALAKPIPRWAFLAGKVAGVLALVTAQAALLIVGTWVALGLRTGIWPSRYLLALPILLAHFALVYGASVLLAVCTRNAAACVFGSLVYWAICAGMNYGRHALAALSPHATAPAVARRAVEVAYWVLPKPLDLVVVLDSALSAGEHFATAPEYEAVNRLGAFHPTWSIAASLLFTAFLFAAAARQFAQDDY
jgi:ABC-type transport system involved in multi-copper enzyme maturation permease subunit